MRFTVGLFVLLFAYSACGSSAFAQKSDINSQLKEANKLFEEGDYSEAYPLFTQLLSLRRGDADITFKYGATLLYGSEKKADAITYLKKASLKSSTDIRVFYFLGKAYHLNYEFDLAIDAYQTFNQKADAKLKEKYDVALSLKQCNNGKELLSQIKDVIVLDRKDVDEKDFFRYYELENLAGKILLAPEEFQSAVDKKKGHVPIVYSTPLSNVVYYSSYGKKGDKGLDIYFSTRKGDGSWSEPNLLPSTINTSYDEDFPFMHPNGKTLYFCSEGHNSMGGFDIFQSVIDPFSNIYSTPENLDFAINTPDNDLLYIADTLNQNAFFASSRASKQGRMSVYEVKVDLLPASIILIKGQFLSEIDPSLKNARITIEDANNKRQIGVFNTGDDASYLVDFSYGGAYNFYVEAGNSGIIHTGKVEVPRLETIAAFRQKLIMIDDDGVERLMIKNYFEEELEGDVKVLLAEALKRRADLKITPDDLVADLMQEQDNAQKIAAFNNLYATVGFTSLHSNQGVANWADEEAAELRSINMEYKALAAKANAESLAHQEIADDLIESAQENFKTFETSTDAAKKQEALRASITQRNEAKLSLLNASSAMMMATRLTEASNERTQVLAAMEVEEIKLRQAIKVEDKKSTEEILSKLYSLEQGIKGDRGGDLDPVDYLADVKELETMKASQAFDYAEDIRKEKSEKLKLLKQLQTQSSNAKSKDKEEFERRISETKAELEEINEILPEKWEEYRTLDWNSKVAEKGLEFANSWDYSIGEYSNINIEDKGLSDEVETAKLEIAAMEEMEVDALLSLGLSYEELMKSPPTTDFATEEESTELALEEYEIEKALLNDYEEKVDAIRNNDNRVDQLEASILLKAELIRELNRSIDINATQYSLEQLSDLKAESEMETVILIDEFKKSIEGQQEATYSVSDYIPEFEEEKGNIQEYSGTDLEKKNRLLEFYNISITRLDLILDSLSMMPMSDIDPFIFRQQIEYQNSLKILITELNVERYEIRENVDLLSRVAELPNEEEMIDYLDAEYEEKYANIVASNSDPDIKEAQIIQLNESLLSKIDIEIASLGREMGKASPSEIPLIRSKVNLLEAISEEKEKEINDAVLEMAKGNVSPDPLVSSNEANEVELDETTRAGMISSIYPDLEKELIAIEVSDMPISDQVNKRYALYADLSDRIDVKVEELGANELGEGSDWILLQNEIDKEMDNMSLYLAEVEESMMDETLIDVELSEEEIISSNAEVWTQAMSYKSTTEAINYFSKQGKIAENPGFESDNLINESKQYYSSIQEYNGLIDQYKALEIKENQVPEKEKKKVRKEKSQLLDKIDEKEADLLIKWIPILQISSEDSDFSNDYLQLSSNAYYAAESAKGEDKNELLKESYLLALMALQEGQNERLQASTSANIPISRFSKDNLDFQSLTVDEKKLILQRNIKEIKLNILAAEEKLAEIALSDDADKQEETSKWQAISKTYQDALVWNQSKLEELNTLEQEVILESAQQVAAIKAPTAPSALDEALLGIGLSADQAQVIRQDPELQTYFAMQYVENEVDSKVSELRMMRSAYVENGNISMEKYNSGNVSTDNPQSAISTHQQNEKYFQDAMTWYQKSDSLNLSIVALENKKASLENDLALFYENLEAINKQTIIEITNGEVPEILEIVEEVVQVDQPIEEDIFEEELVAEIILEEEVREEETLLEEEALVEMERGDSDSDGFMYEAGNVFYSTQDPIPVNPPLPQGLIFKVQIGAFRNPLPVEHFVGLSPMMAEKLSNGITRYSVGIFREIEVAKSAKDQVRGLGYNDAFVIAFLNGERIPLNRALQMIGEPVESTPLAANNNRPLESKATSADARNGTNNTTSTNLNSTPEEVNATPISSENGLFYCVQVGVFSKKVQKGELFGIEPLNIELTGSGYYRYTSGRFASVAEASRQKNTIVAKGVSDAFVTAYYQGGRISLDRAKMISEEEPANVIETSTIIPEGEEEEEEVEGVDEEEEVEEVVEEPVVDENLPKASDLTFVIYIGSYINSIPNNVATALLENSDVGIKRAVNGGKMIYSTKELDTFTEATVILQRFQEKDVEQAKMLYVLDGNEISEQKALEILAR